MSKSMNMLRTRRKDNNVKPNRRLDRKSSRGMIYENEELRLKTININAEIERGQSDIKKLRRENEMLKKEIWCLRDEYEKLDKLLKDKEVSFSSTSTTCSSDSETSCTEEMEEVETSQNLQNDQKTNMKNLNVDFDHLSVVPEENSTENSDKNSLPNEDVIKPDQAYPSFLQQPKHFFAPLPNYTENTFQRELEPLDKTSSDLIVKCDDFDEKSGFSNGGNLEELLNDIQTISKDILRLSSQNLTEVEGKTSPVHKSELNVVLMPAPMPLLGFEKYQNLKSSNDNLIKFDQLPPLPMVAGGSNINDRNPTNINYDDNYLTTPPPNFLFPSNNIMARYNYNPQPVKDANTSNSTSRSNLLDVSEKEHVSSENDENSRSKELLSVDSKSGDKLGIRRKVSIHFKGKKDKDVKNENRILRKTPSVDSSKHSSDEKNDKKVVANNVNSASVTPERKHVQLKDHDKRHKKQKQLSDKVRNRRNTISTDRMHNRERSFSVCTANSNNHHAFDDCTTSERERTNSISSSGTGAVPRKMSNMSNFPVSGKIPWCGCWGNGCL